MNIFVFAIPDMDGDGGCFLLLMGAIVWGVFGRSNSTLQTVVASNGTEALTYVKVEDRYKIIGKTLTVNGRQCTMTSVFLDTLVPVEEAFDEYALFVGCLQRGEWVYAVSLDDAWEVAEMVGIAEDIHRMPMGMHTIFLPSGSVTASFTLKRGKLPRMAPMMS